MPDNTSHEPRPVPQVVVSSTFDDLHEHRAALIDGIHKHKLHANVMEHDDAKLEGDVIDSSLGMVRSSAAYVLVIGFKYGQVPECPDRNPDQRSITELEFDEAQRLGRPTLLFVMGDDHLVKKGDIEADPDKQMKLDAFRERAKKAPNSSVHRVYAVFNSLDELKDRMASSLSELAQRLTVSATDPRPADATQETDVASGTIPSPPAFYAEPDYIGSHDFVGRARELEELSDWASPDDQTNLLLFEAIGGNGKSMLTWEWTTRHATQVRDDWAGRFWYSFYERGAVMADFCQRALAYMTGQPLEELRKKMTAELREPLLAELHTKPWLLVLDGLERVLVAYHRIDAAEMRDEDANNPTDAIVNRDPCDAIRDEDNDLLRALAAAAPSKILVSSRLTPRILLNPSGQPIGGAKRITLPGLRPPDAEQLLRSCGIEGDPAAIQSYLRTNCDNHPLVIGILGGLINNYLPSRGDFDAWAFDPGAGDGLDLGSLDLIQRRNHILRSAIGALPPSSRQLLSTLALLPESADYETLVALSPHDPNKATELNETVGDLERRALLQYDRLTRRHDLHPVVRGVAAGGMEREEKQDLGQRVLDHFSSLSQDPYEQADTVEDLRYGLTVLRTQLKLGRLEHALDTLALGLAPALLFNVDAPGELLSLLRPFFPESWSDTPGVGGDHAAQLANLAGAALAGCNEHDEALLAHGTALRLELQGGIYTNSNVVNAGQSLFGMNKLADAFRHYELAVDLAEALEDREDHFAAVHALMTIQSHIGLFDEAESSWQFLESMGRRWSRSAYRPGEAEDSYALLQFYRGTLEERHLTAAERLAREGRNRATTRSLLRLRGAWHLGASEWERAEASYAEAVRMARERGIPSASSEAGLALAKLHLGRLTDPLGEAERLAQQRPRPDGLLAQLWLVLEDPQQAKQYALSSYQKAWADGEPFVARHQLNRSRELLERMGVPEPKLAPYDPDEREPFPWEADVRGAVERLRSTDLRAKRSS